MQDRRFEDVILGELSGPAQIWLGAALRSDDPNQLSVDFTLAPRKLGKDAAAPLLAGAEWLCRGGTRDEIARVALLCRAARFADDPVALASEWYRVGDAREQRAVVRTLFLLPDAGRYALIARTACRSSVQTVFDGLCCENPYPAAFLDDGGFNQMVLKAFFTGVEMARVVGLESRKNPELSRMAADYASERRAAGRTVPHDLPSVLLPTRRDTEAMT